jgi:predicted nucleic acid-binding protein
MISARAARIRADHGLRTPDAIHAATALNSGAAGMVTNDMHMLKLESRDFGIWLFDAPD